jgi:hypothetical protein
MWGVRSNEVLDTFTSFQDTQGLTISGINVDDEPDAGAPRCHPDVTLRLETPFCTSIRSATFRSTGRSTCALRSPADG